MSSRSVTRPIDRPALLVMSVIAVVATGAASVMGPIVGAGCIVAFAIAFVMLRHPVIAGYSVVMLVPVTSGLKRGVPLPGLRISETLVVLGGVTVLGFAARREVPRFGAVDWLLFAYALSSALLPLVHTVLQHVPLNIGSFGSVLLPLQFFILYRVVRVGLQTEQQRRMATRMLLFSSVFVCALATLQQLNVGPARAFAVRLTDADALQGYAYEVFARATGPFQHWHPLAGYLTVILLLLIALLLDDEQRIMSRRSLVLLTLFNLCALMLSVTFTSMFAVMVGTIVLGVWSGRARSTLMWCVAGGVAGVCLFSSLLVSRFDSQYAPGTNSILPQTVGNRLAVWTNDYLPAMAGRWASGYGAGLPKDVVWTHTESGYFTIVLRGGIPLLALFVASMVALMFIATRNRRVSPLVAALAAVVMVMWIMNLLYPYATSSGMAQPFWVLAGIALGTLQVKEKAGRRKPERVDPVVESQSLQSSIGGREREWQVTT